MIHSPLHTNLLWDVSCALAIAASLYLPYFTHYNNPVSQTRMLCALLMERNSRPGRPGSGDRPFFGMEGPPPFHGDPAFQKKGSASRDPELIPRSKALDNIEVDYEVLIDPAIEKQICEILQAYTTEFQHREMEFVRKNREQDRPEDDGFMLDLGKLDFPAAKFYNKRESKKVKLLYAIAELGDIREIPFLQRMLYQEKSESISLLIKEILFEFLAQPSTHRKPVLPVLPKTFFEGNYVYSYLFHSVDTESQYLLLDEIYAIGQQEELDFLRTLQEHAQEGIRKKAAAYILQLEKNWGTQVRAKEKKERFLETSGGHREAESERSETLGTAPLAIIGEEDDLFHIDFKLDVSHIHDGISGNPALVPGEPERFNRPLSVNQVMINILGRMRDSSRNKG